MTKPCENVLSRNLYFYLFEGQLYFGHTRHIPGITNGFEIVFRNKPMVSGRWYKSLDYWFKAFPLKKEWCLQIHDVSKEEPLYKALIIKPGPVHIYREHQPVFKLHSEHPQAMSDFTNGFRNRLKEYTGCHFLAPFTKRRQRLFL